MSTTRRIMLKLFAEQHRTSVTVLIQQSGHTVASHLKSGRLMAQGSLINKQSQGLYAPIKPIVETLSKTVSDFNKTQPFTKIQPKVQETHQQWQKKLSDFKEQFVASITQCQKVIEESAARNAVREAAISEAIAANRPLPLSDDAVYGGFVTALNEEYKQAQRLANTVQRYVKDLKGLDIISPEHRSELESAARTATLSSEEGGYTTYGT